MKKFTKIQVKTPVELVYPSDFLEAVQALGVEVFAGAASKERLRMWSSGRLIVAKESPFSAIAESKLSYIHLSRLAEKVGTVALDFMSLAVKIDPRLSDPTAIGGIDLAHVVDKHLEIISEIKTVDGAEATMNSLVDYEDAENPEGRIFALSYQPMFAEGVASSTSILFRHMSEAVRGCIASVDPKLFALGREGVQSIEDTIPFAKVNSYTMKELHEFRETFTSNLLDPDVRVLAHAMQVDTTL